MTTYRIYYVEREAPGRDASSFLSDTGSFGGAKINLDQASGTEWEETYDGKDAKEALEAFFRDHAASGDVRLLEEDGGSRPMETDEALDPDRTYVWMESDKLMEYQGLDEATEGMVSCPLCDGTGEVDEAVAEEFLASAGSSDDE